MPDILARMDDTPNNDEPRTYEEMMNDDNLTEESLQDELRKYKEAYQQEYEIKMKRVADGEVDPKQITDYTRDYFKANLAGAAAQIVWLSSNADSETVSLSASKFVVEQALTDAKVDGDPVAALLAQLQANDPKPETAPSE